MVLDQNKCKMYLYPTKTPDPAWTGLCVFLEPDPNKMKQHLIALLLTYYCDFFQCLNILFLFLLCFSCFMFALCIVMSMSDTNKLASPYLENVKLVLIVSTLFLFVQIT